MSIASRITTIQEHIGDVYDTLEIGGTDTAEIDKNIVNINTAIKNQYKYFLAHGTEQLWEDWEKITATGTNLALTPTTEGKMEFTKLSGDTFQQSYTGSNLLNRTTCNENKDLIWANGNLIDKTGSITSDYISVNNLTNIASNYYFFIAFYNSSKSYLGNDTDLRTTGGTARKTINISNIVSNYSSIAYFKLCFKSANNNSTDMTTVDIMLNTGTTALDYEPYTGNQPAPNPDYPQDIQVVTGNNNILVNNGNLGNMTALYNEMYAFNPSYVRQETVDNKNCIVFANSRFRSSNGFKGLQKRYKENTRYRLNLDMRVYNTSYIGGYATYIEFWYKDGTYTRKGTSANGSNWYNLEMLSDVNKTIDFIAFTFGDGADWCMANLSIIEYVEGQTYEYKESKEQNYPIIFSENILDGQFIIGYYGVDNGLLTESDTRITCKNLIPVKPNTTYTFGDYEKTKQYVFYNENGNYISGGTLYSGSKQSFTTSSTCKYIRINVISLADVNAQVMLAEGNKMLQFQPYSQQQIELCKIGTYQDYIYKSDDNWYIHREIDKKILNGTESNWAIPSKTTNLFMNDSTTTFKSLYAIQNAYSNYYRNVVDSRITGNSQANSYLSDGQFTLRDGNTKDRIYIKDTRFTTLPSLKNWLSTHNLIVYYVLLTPTDTQITDTTLINQLEAIEEATGYNGTTYIISINSNSNNLAIIPTIKVLKDI